MLLLLRCDAGARLGVGHAVRCIALAEAARARGHRVQWCGRLADVPWLHADSVLAETAVHPPEDDPLRLAGLARAIGADAVHIDHYGLPVSLRGPLNALGVSMSNIEDSDHGRRPADIVIDPNLGAGSRPRPADGSTNVLRGLSYAMLRRSVVDARHARSDTSALPDSPRVLVVMGGTDAVGLLAPVLAALHAAAVPADVDVIVPAGHELRFPAGGPVRWNASPPRADLPRLMAGADLVVSAAGTTVWELCCVGVPMALARATANQAEGYAAVIAAGAAAGLGGVDELHDTEATAVTLRALLRDVAARTELGRRAADLVDGYGASRVVAAVEETAAPRASPALHARRADAADARLLYEWRNDQATRRWSRSSDAVAWPDHVRWLDRSLAREDRLLLIVEDSVRTPVGTVRWDREAGGAWEVSVTLAPEQRGRGLALSVLRSGEDALVGYQGPGVIVRAYIHRDNATSQRLFARAGYVPDSAARSLRFAPYRKALT